jgi:hypothetical protein
LHRLGRGDGGVLVGNKPLMPPPGSAPSHEISPRPMAQDPGGWIYEMGIIMGISMG